jgi:hypothetical protein
MRLPQLILIGASTCTLAGLAHAQATPYFIGLSQNLTYERNVLRLGNNVAAPTGLQRADTVAVTALQGGINQSFGRQRGYANLSLRQVTYNNNSVYNNQAYTGSAGLDWSTVERISGTLSGTVNRSLSSFGSFGLGVQDKNFEDSQGLGATISVGVVTEFSAEAGYNHREVRNSLQNRAVLSRDFDQDSGTLGVRWRPDAALNVGLVLRDTRGRYPKFQQVADGSFLADRFKQQGIEINGSIQPSGGSTVDFRIGQNKTSYDLNQARDFSGLTGSVGWTWQATGKVRVTSRLSRDTGQDSYAVAQFNVPATSDYSRVSDVLRIQADWDFSAKINFSAAWQNYRRSYTQSAPSFLTDGRTSASGRESGNELSFGVRWAPYRTSSFGCDVAAEVRAGSGELAASMRNYNVGCFGQLQLQL